MGYADQLATRSALELVERHKQETARLKAAIVEHYKQIHQNNWSADDALWEAIGLVADVEAIG